MDIIYSIRDLFKGFIKIIFEEVFFMLKSFKETFGDFMLDRTIEIGDNVLMHNEEYKQIGNKADELFHQIKKLLPKKQQHLMLDLESYYNDKMTLSQDIIYEQGLKDGIEIKNFVKLVV